MGIMSDEMAESLKGFAECNHNEWVCASCNAKTTLKTIRGDLEAVNKRLLDGLGEAEILLKNMQLQFDESQADNQRLREAIRKYLYESAKGKQDEFDLAEALEKNNVRNE